MCFQYLCMLRWVVLKHEGGYRLGSVDVVSEPILVISLNMPCSIYLFLSNNILFLNPYVTYFFSSTLVFISLFYPQLIDPSHYSPPPPFFFLPTVRSFCLFFLCNFKFSFALSLDRDLLGKKEIFGFLCWFLKE